MQMFRWLFFIIIVAIIEIYAFQAFKTIIKTRWFLVVYEVVSLAFIGYLIYSFCFDEYLKIPQKKVVNNTQYLFHQELIF